MLSKGTMSSLLIAEITGKLHNDVLKAIRVMEPAWEKVTEGKFSLSKYKDSTGRSLPYYELTKRECLYIATKFNDEARAKLILRWEELETHSHTSTPPSSLTPSELILELARVNVENEQKLRQIESRQQKLETTLGEVLSRTDNTLDRSTIVAYVKRHDIPLDLRRFGAMGRKASDLCRKRGITPTKLSDPRWGTVSVYPDTILDEIFSSIIKQKGGER